MNRPNTIDPHIKNIVFDFGGVLVDWNPRYLYRKYFSTVGFALGFVLMMVLDVVMG
ncbi:MAG: hypothetical protein J5635_03150 [Paludibacteraceae bacterium]|nr:hypothetical protein [Paludibacteraceae bacterium]